MMSEKQVDSDRQATIPFGQANPDRMLALAECQRVGPQYGWSKEYLAGLDETDRIAQNLQGLDLRFDAIVARIEDLKRKKKKAQEHARQVSDAEIKRRLAAAAGLAQQRIEELLDEKRATEEQIEKLRQAYEAAREHVWGSF